jgi:DNA helicase-2/ATP-dependent DNA helicase PcrA
VLAIAQHFPLTTMALTLQDVQAAQAVQTAAAHAPESQVRLVAGPGSGKSSTIEERVSWLLGQGIDPIQIAVVSFTNASVIDLRLRLHAYCQARNQAGIGDVSITTLHSLALRLLRQAGLLANYPTRPLVLDEWELENIYDEEFGRSQQIASKPRREKIRRFYEALWSTGQPNALTYVPANPPITVQEQQRFTAFHQPTSQVYSCVLPGEIVRKCADAAATGVIDIAQLLGISQLIVDEYQDLNPVDLEFVDRLAAAGVTIFAAGDDDQSIYSFRHASPLGIQTFGVTYPNAALHALQHCFRCTHAVLAAATTLILNNAAPNRIQKAMVSLYQTANPVNTGFVHRWRFLTATQEAAAIAESCAALIGAGLAPRKILILLANRSNTAGLWPPLREALEQSQVPFDPPKEESFADSEAGRLVLALMRIICSRDENGVPEDLVAHRIVLGSKSGVGTGTCDAIRGAVIATANLSFRALFYDPLPNGVFNGRATAALNSGRQICATIAAWQPDNTLTQRLPAIDGILRATIDDGAADAWRAFAAPLPPDMTLSELRDYVWVDNSQQRAEVLQAVAQRIGNAAQAAPELDRVRVMTMHGAKGLSAHVVFIPGLEQGVLPNQHQAPYPAQLLEAARLLYVSITRARAVCVMSFALRRMIFGTFQQQHASPFAMQTGGAFVARNGGLSVAETATVLQLIGDL